MAIFTAAAAFVSAAVGGGLFGAIAGFAARTLLTVGISKLIGNRAGANAAGTSDVGSRVHVPPASNNKLPVVYGKAYMGSTVTDMKISDDGKKMWYVCSICEVTNTMPTQTPDTMTFGNIYWGGKKVIFDGSDTSKVIRLETNSDPVQVDDKVNGKIHMYRFPNGSASGIDTGGSNAITIMSDASIPADLRWNSALYTSGGQSASMTNVAFVIVTVDYDQNAGTQNLVPINVEITNSRSAPGDVIEDYLFNDVYGCAVPSTSIDTASLTALNVYSAELINFIDVDGNPATQARYVINGPVQTGDNCLANLQQLVDACDSWLQYSELTGMWKVVINKEFDGVIGDLYQVTDSNLMSGINVNPIDLNSAFNKLEVQYPNTFVLDKTDYANFNLVDFVPEVMSYNEPSNQLTVQYPQVNNYIQAAYLGQRRLLQSREDLIIDFALDYSGIQIEAGDVITVKFEPYGWEAFNSGEGKLFRVSQVQEAKIDDGSLGVRVTAFEYNATIYANNPLQDFIPEANTGLKDPSISTQPGTPIFTINTLANSGAVTSFSMTSTVPTSGTIMAMDFNLGNSSNIQTHKLYTTLNSADGIPFTNSQSLTISINDQQIGNYYGSVTARTIGNTGYASNVSNVFNWTANLQANSVTYTNMSNTVNITTSVGGYTYEIPNNFANTVALPININTLGNVNSTRGTDWDLPKYLNVTYTGGDGLFPYYQGNSSTLKGYSQNSTSQYQPALSSQLAIVNGDLNWYALEYRPTTQTVSTLEQMTINYISRIVSDIDCAIQLAGFVTFTTSANYILVDTAAFLSTYTLYAGAPQQIDLRIPTIGSSDLNGGGILIRSFTAGANIQTTAGSLALSKQKR